MNQLNIRHLALILDGNRRWGNQHGIAMNIDFYVQSGLLGQDIARTVFDRGIDYLTIWIGSISNLTKRSALELKALNKAYKKFFSDPDNLQFMKERRIKIDCFGRWRDLLESSTITVIEKALLETADFADSGKILTVLIGYDGSDERGEALRNILNSAGKQEKNLQSKELNNLLRKKSWTGHLPDVDLVIRTGSGIDPHNSAGFLSLLTDNVQYEFLDTLWPDFTSDDLSGILNEFANRERRMGK